MTAPAKVLELISLFDRNADAYMGGHYNETQVRQEFINPLFKSLGWDMDNEQGYAEAYKDVIHEDAIKIGGATKAPDYCFRIGGARKFFLEAKKPSVHLKVDPAPAYQLRRYAWSAKLPLSVLTNFAELAVYDCRVKPDQNDKASAGRTLYLTSGELAARWDELAGIFARDSILKGSFDKYAETTKGKRGTATVDAAFLQEIEGWRELLAKNLAVRNPHLSQRELNYAVQVTIDRIIFLRMCEDRGVEIYGQLMALLNGPAVYGRLKQLFHNADDRYNSGLFYFKKEPGHTEEPDELTPSLVIDDKPLKDIIKGLYYPESPYEFSVLSAEILGQVYEQFLGKVIRLTAGHQAKVEDKPEVKKAGGVYYTPAYIVEYIVKNTVGKLLAEPGASATGGTSNSLTPRQAAKLRILDPACGSGSFLLGAYQYLLNWHRDWYLANGADKHAKEIYQGLGGVWRLTTAEKRRILLNNIYGVDIDPQAVEVTKLSLLLKVLEGESQQSLETQLRLFHERALPDLGSNIKCGNSLIGPDFYEGQQGSLFDEEEQYRINVFDWNANFPQIMNGGGFDVVIGNPPYIRIQTLQEWAPLVVEFYKTRYRAASKGNYDIYVVFVERGLELLRARGRLGFILPHKFFNAMYGEALRGLIAEGRNVTEVVHFGSRQVFDGATTYTCLLFLDKSGCDECRFVKVDDIIAWRTNATDEHSTIPASFITESEWNFVVGKHAPLFEKLKRVRTKLGDIASLFVGLQTDADAIFILKQVEQEKNRVLCESKATGEMHWFENDHLKPFLKGSLNIRRYHLSDVNKRLIFPYETRDGKSVLLDAKEYKDRYPLTWTYLEQNRESLVARNRGKMGREWYGYVYKKNHRRFSGEKLIVPSIATGSCFALDLHGIYYFVGSGGGGGGGYGITLRPEMRGEENQQGLSYRYLLGVLNSRLLSEYLRSVSTPFRGGYIALNRQYIEQLPIRTIDFTNKENRLQHDRMVALVEQMLGLHNRLSKAKAPHDKAVLQSQIAATDRQIDRLVYELYGLTEEEVRNVEEGTTP